MKILCFYLVFVGLLGPSFERSTPEDDSYVAAVLEYASVSNATVNLDNYLGYISDAASQNADIIVFPELTLRSSPFQVPINGDLRQYPIPYLNTTLYDPVLVTLSRAAAEHQIYVLVNVEELVNCTDNLQGELCPESRVYLFNTNVVFDRNGAVIDRYRKINLFGEYTRTPALNPDLGVFTTDFGVTFGHFICFDLMFQIPAVQVVQKLNLTDVIFSTMWFSELPYLTAVQIQQAYAYTLNVNMLASGANNVRVGSAGSGIYSGRAGALVSTMPGVPTSSLLIARVPKIPGQIANLIDPSNTIDQTNSLAGQITANPEDDDELFLIRDPSIPSHVSRLLVDGFQEFVLSDKEVSCTFRVNMSHGSAETGPRFRAVTRDGSNIYAHREIGVVDCAVIACENDDIKSCGYRYRAAVFDGIRSFSGVATGGTRVCSVIQCTTDELESCGDRFPEYLQGRTASFSELSITASLPTPRWRPDIDAYDTFYVPLSVDTSIQTLQPEEFTFTPTESGDITTYLLSLNTFHRELYSFAVWGRVFEWDGLDATPPISSSVVQKAGILCSLVALLLAVF